MGSATPYFSELRCDLRTLLSLWAEHFTPEPQQQLVLVERVIAVACHNERLLTSRDVKLELFKIMHALAAEQLLRPRRRRRPKKTGMNSVSAA